MPKDKLRFLVKTGLERARRLDVIIPDAALSLPLGDLRLMLPSRSTRGKRRIVVTDLVTAHADGKVANVAVILPEELRNIDLTTVTLVIPPGLLKRGRIEHYSEAKIEAARENGKRPARRGKVKGRPKRWPDKLKKRILKEIEKSSEYAKDVCKRWGVHPQMISAWKRLKL